MAIDLRKFFEATNPSKTLAVNHPEDRKYYINFSSEKEKYSLSLGIGEITSKAKSSKMLYRCHYYYKLRESVRIT
jgi:hypothetical protein